MRTSVGHPPVGHGTCRQGAQAQGASLHRNALCHPRRAQLLELLLKMGVAVFPTTMSGGVRRPKSDSTLCWPVILSFSACSGPNSGISNQSVSPVSLSLACSRLRCNTSPPHKMAKRFEGKVVLITGGSTGSQISRLHACVYIDQANCWLPSNRLVCASNALLRYCSTYSTWQPECSQQVCIALIRCPPCSGMLTPSDRSRKPLKAPS